jgi:hypothetical protein
MARAHAGRPSQRIGRLARRRCRLLFPHRLHTPSRQGHHHLVPAGQTLPGEKKEGAASDPSKRFRYTKQVLDGNTAVLEFETTIDGKYVNGVDIITCNDAGKIIEFRVMIRPLQAINLVHQQMADMLDRMKPQS